MAIRDSAAGKAKQLRFERRCAPVPSFLTGTRDVGRAPSQALSPRPGRLAQELWEKKRGRRERAGSGRRGRTGRTGRKGAGLSLDCVNPRARTATCRCGQSSPCEDSLQKPRSWAHTVILRPEPSVDYRTLGLAVALLGVLSRVRRSLAQSWDAQHDVDFFLWPQGQKQTASDAGHISKKEEGPRGSHSASGFRPRSAKKWVTTTSCRKDMRDVCGVFWRRRRWLVGRSGPSG